MIKQNKTKLQFILGAILFLSVAVTACNNDGEKKETVKDEPVITAPAVTDSIDTNHMEKMKGGVSPVDEIKPK
jgi:hypothetical protein